jgi:hypothetical protein
MAPSFGAATLSTTGAKRLLPLWTRRFTHSLSSIHVIALLDRAIQ